MKIHKISILIALVGLFILGVSWIQWFFLYPDTSQLFLGTLCGINVLGWAYVYNWMKQQDVLTLDWENRFQGLLKIYFKGEFG